MKSCPWGNPWLFQLSEELLHQHIEQAEQADPAKRLGGRHELTRGGRLWPATQRLRRNVLGIGQ
jgi:hypothetical protein